MQNFPYIELSIAVGIVQGVDAVFLYKARGAVNKWLLTFSIFEYVWVAISLSALSSSAPRWLPMSFVIYIVAGFAYGILLSKDPNTGAESKAIPVWFVIFGGFFGVYFAAASLYVSLFA